LFLGDCALLRAWLLSWLRVILVSYAGPNK